MMNRKARCSRMAYPAGAGLLAILLLAVSSIFVTPVGAAPVRQTQSEVEMLRPLSGKEFEVEFLNAMIMHHQGAIDMANMALDRAGHSEVKTLARPIVDAQTREIADMTGWLQSWYNLMPDHNMGHGGMGMGDMTKLASLQGDAFDQEFLTEMRMHHMDAVAMAELIPSRATHSELKTLGENIIRTQTAEIQQIESWLKAWYNVDVAGGPMPGGEMGGTPGMPRTGAAGGLLTPSLLLLAFLSLLAGLALTWRTLRQRRA